MIQKLQKIALSHYNCTWDFEVLEVSLCWQGERKKHIQSVRSIRVPFPAICFDDTYRKIITYTPACFLRVLTKSSLNNYSFLSFISMSIKLQEPQRESGFVLPLACSVCKQHKDTVLCTHCTSNWRLCSVELPQSSPQLSSHWSGKVKIPLKSQRR